MKPTSADPETLYEGRFLRIVRRGRWEYAARAKATGVVSVVALHDDGRIVLVEQHRPPVNASVVELPAGLAGDTDARETLLEAAKRELLEETGYAAARWTPLPTLLSSAGLTDEAVTFFLARGLFRAGPGGGDGSESITVHEPPLVDLPAWLQSAMTRGAQVDAKLLAGVYAATALAREERP